MLVNGGQLNSLSGLICRVYLFIHSHSFSQATDDNKSTGGETNRKDLEQCTIETMEPRTSMLNISGHLGSAVPPQMSPQHASVQVLCAAFVFLPEGSGCQTGQGPGTLPPRHTHFYIGRWFQAKCLIWRLPRHQ